MVFDNEGERYDVHGKAGKLKIKGLQIQRSDTPMIVRKLLKENDGIFYYRLVKKEELIILLNHFIMMNGIHYNLGKKEHQKLLMV